MRNWRLGKRVVVVVAVLLLAGQIACRVGRPPSSEVIIITPTPATEDASSDSDTPEPTPTSSAPEEPTTTSHTPTPLPEPTSMPEEGATPLPGPDEPESPTEGVIVDNLDPGFTIEAGEWEACKNGDCSGTCFGADFMFAAPECLDCRARFDVVAPAGGEYDLLTWWPWGEDRSTDTPFTISYSQDTFTIDVDQRNSGDDWWWLATVTLEAGETLSVLVEGSASGYANADAVTLVPTGAAAASDQPPADESGEEPAKAPVIQYFYVEEAPTPGCYYLHWDVSHAGYVALNDMQVDNPGSSEVCPEETTSFLLYAENDSGQVDQSLTIEVIVSEELIPTLIPDEESQPLSEGDFQRIIFLHHSCGANLIEQGGVRAGLTGRGYEFYDHGYNEEGLVLADGTWTGQNFDVPGDNTDPDGYATIFAQPLDVPPDNTFSHLMQYDVIAFKSCYPVSNIWDDDLLSQYMSYYLSIRDRMDQYPDKIFIVVTQPPQVPNETNPEEAARARTFTDWLASDEFLAGHPNVFTFNFFDLLADPGENVLRPEYRGDEWDAHPNGLANQGIGPLFVDFIDQAIQSYSH